MEAEFTSPSNPGQAGATTVTFGAQLRRAAPSNCSGCRWRRNWGRRITRSRARPAACTRKRGLASDQITVTAQGTDVYDAVIQIVSTES